MSNELERAFAALSDDAGRARPETAGTLRRRGDRQRAVTVAATSVAVAVLVAGTVFGSRMVLAGPDGSMPVPADSGPVVSPSPARPSTTPTTTPQSTPPSTPPSSTGRSIPKSVPAAAFLGAADVPGKLKEPPSRLGAGDHDLPSFCGDTIEPDKLGVRATQVLYYTGLDSPPDSTPKSAVYEDIMVFRGAGAEAFMAGLRAAVRDCPAEPGSVKNYLRRSLGTGDDSVLIEQTRPATDDAGEPVGGGALHHLYWAVVRVGDSVAFVSDTGWESGSPDRADTEHMGKRAGQRLAAWRD